ncbi:MAG: hypothetical protein R2754_10755 [Microthrixaceae bacterium]
MIDNPERLEQFTNEVAEMRLPDTRSSRERLLLIGGIASMALGVIVTIVAYFVSHGTTNPLQQRDAIVIALIGLAVAIVGSAAFLRYSIAQFLRFWLARNSWEQSAHTDRLVAALKQED